MKLKWKKTRGTKVWLALKHGFYFRITKIVTKAGKDRYFWDIISGPWERCIVCGPSQTVEIAKLECQMIAEVIDTHIQNAIVSAMMTADH